jgi:hypothetical protein
MPKEKMPEAVRSKAMDYAAEDNQQLRAVLLTLEWSFPVPEGAETDGVCPTCYASKPVKLTIIDGYRTLTVDHEPQEFSAVNHMVHCRLAKALNLKKMRYIKRS